MTEWMRKVLRRHAYGASRLEPISVFRAGGEPRNAALIPATTFRDRPSTGASASPSGDHGDRKCPRHRPSPPSPRPFSFSLSFALGENFTTCRDSIRTGSLVCGLRTMLGARVKYLDRVIARRRVKWARAGTNGVGLVLGHKPLDGVAAQRTPSYAGKGGVLGLALSFAEPLFECTDRVLA